MSQAIVDRLGALDTTLLSDVWRRLSGGSALDARNLSRCARGGPPLPGVELLLRRERAVVIRTLASLIARRTDGLPVQPALRYLAWLGARYAPLSRN